jgi:nucleoside-diphosphate-sugar epimerase
MTLIIVGSCGNIGRRLKTAFPSALGIDRHPDADIVAELSAIDYDAAPVRRAFENCDGLIHVATSANVDDPAAVHWRAVVNTARLVEACAGYGIPRLVLPSSDWAEPKSAMAKINVYGHSKRVMEALAAMYAMTPGRRAVALRFGWVPGDASELQEAEDWLLANYWDDARLIAEVTAALGD